MPGPENSAPGREGLFLVFEGVEGAGKSTHAARLARYLDERGVPSRLVREPGGTEAGERIRDIVLNPVIDLTAETELLLMLAARAQFVREVVRPALSRGEVVLADRYELSTFAYQGLARGLGLDDVRPLNRFATGGLAPDLTLLLMIDLEESRRRRSGESPDRMEGEEGAFHDRVHRAYRRLAEEEEGVVSVDAHGSREDVAARILEELSGRWPDLFEPE